MQIIILSRDQCRAPEVNQFCICISKDEKNTLNSIYVSFPVCKCHLIACCQCFIWFCFCLILSCMNLQNLLYWKHKQNAGTKKQKKIFFFKSCKIIIDCISYYDYKNVYSRTTKVHIVLCCCCVSYCLVLATTLYHGMI